MWLGGLGLGKVLGDTFGRGADIYNLIRGDIKKGGFLLSGHLPAGLLKLVQVFNFFKRMVWAKSLTKKQSRKRTRQ